jgi:hypothetical protein
MIQSLFIGIAGILLLSLFWVLIQAFWKTEFSDYITDEDVLAGRTSCGNCGCTTACPNKKSTQI